MKNLISVFCLLGLASLGLCGEGADDKPKAAFRSAAVKRGPLEVTVRASGTVEPEEVVDVGAQVAGQIQEFGRDPGDAAKSIDYGSQVEAGTVLAQIDPRIYRTQLDQARAGLQRAEAELAAASAQLQLAERDWQRIKKLGNKDIPVREVDAYPGKYDVARAGVEVRKAAVKESQAGVQLRELNLDYCTIRSPIKGIIIDRRVNIGQAVMASLSAPTLFLIAKELKRVQVWVSVNEADIGQVREKQAATFTVEAFPGQVFRGQVNKVRLNAALTQNVVTYTVVVHTDNSSGKLLPYLTADVQIIVAHRENALLVPNAALRWRPRPAQVAPKFRKEYERSIARAGVAELPGKADKDRGERGVVWVEEKGFVRPVEVRTGLTDGTQTEVVGRELVSGTEVVTGVAAPPPERKRGQGPAADTKRMLASLEVRTLLVQPGSGGVNFGSGIIFTLTPQDAEAVARECPAVAAVAPLVRARTQVVVGNKNWVPLYIYGSTPSYLAVRDWQDLQEGDPFTDRDVRSGNKVCLVGQTLVHELFGDASPVGRTLRFQNVSFRVIGVLSRKGANYIGLDQDDMVLVPWTALVAVTGTDKLSTDKPAPGEGAPADKPEPRVPRTIHQILVQAKSANDVPAASREITELLRKRHRIRQGQPDDFYILDLTELKKTLEGRSR